MTDGQNSRLAPVKSLYESCISVVLMIGLWGFLGQMSLRYLALRTRLCRTTSTSISRRMDRLSGLLSDWLCPLREIAPNGQLQRANSTTRFLIRIPHRENCTVTVRILGTANCNFGCCWQHAPPPPTFFPSLSLHLHCLVCLVLGILHLTLFFSFLSVIAKPSGYCLSRYLQIRHFYLMPWFSSLFHSKTLSPPPVPVFGFVPLL
jgi:hypothetical protein